jgi:hypothetical protein
MGSIKGKSKIQMGQIGKKKSKKRIKPTESGIKKEKNQDDLEYIKKVVQALCKNTNPLGKSLDFIRDDIENMNNEKNTWR